MKIQAFNATKACISNENVFLKNNIFFLELHLISFSSNPKGGNQALSIGIRGRHVSVFSCYLMKNVFLQKPHIFLELDLISLIANPLGGNQAPSIRIRGRHVSLFSPHLTETMVFGQKLDFGGKDFWFLVKNWTLEVRIFCFWSKIGLWR